MIFDFEDLECQIWNTYSTSTCRSGSPCESTLNKHRIIPFQVSKLVLKVCLDGLVVRAMEKYENLGLVGEGSYGMVLKCKHKETGQIVAIKKFLESEDDKMVKKIAMREVRMLKQLRHENLVNLIEVFRRKKRLYLVFEFVDHTVLDDLERCPNGLDEDTVRKVLYQVLKGIEFCHLHNIIHRDIKPENILVSRGQVVKLCDFGFARTLAQPGEAYTDYVATRWYRAPELLVGDTKYGRAVDIWAVGCLLAEMLTGEPLFPGDSDIDQLYHIVKCFGNLTQRHREIFYKNPLFVGMRLPEVRETEPLEKKFPRLSTLALDLMKLCLRLDADDRPTCSQLLRNEFFHKDGFAGKFAQELKSRIQRETHDNPLSKGQNHRRTSDHPAKDTEDNKDKDHKDAKKKKKEKIEKADKEKKDSKESKESKESKDSGEEKPKRKLPDPEKFAKKTTPTVNTNSNLNLASSNTAITNGSSSIGGAATKQSPHMMAEGATELQSVTPSGGSSMPPIQATPGQPTVASPMGSSAAAAFTASVNHLSLSWASILGGLTTGGPQPHSPQTGQLSPIPPASPVSPGGGSRSSVAMSPTPTTIMYTSTSRAASRVSLVTDLSGRSRASTMTIASGKSQGAGSPLPVRRGLHGAATGHHHPHHHGLRQQLVPTPHMIFMMPQQVCRPPSPQHGQPAVAQPSGPTEKVKKTPPNHYKKMAPPNHHSSTISPSLQTEKTSLHDKVAAYDRAKRKSKDDGKTGISFPEVRGAEANPNKTKSKKSYIATIPHIANIDPFSDGANQNNSPSPEKDSNLPLV